jgi:predicted transcriptional regulator
MKTKSTKTETSTCSASIAHDGQNAADTNKANKYRVVLYYTQTCEVVVNLEVESLAQAEALADEIESEQLTDDDLNPISGELVVDSVKLISGGQDHE